MHSSLSLASKCSILSFSLLFCPAAAWGVSIDWVGIDAPGNSADDTGFGSVANAYRIGAVEVTNTQYTEFLNAIADTDANGLYNTSMGTASQGGITRSGDSGSYSYAPRDGRADRPVNYISYYDALRFVNWLENGQPVTGEQTAESTEDGSYTFSGTTSAGSRNDNASIFLPSEDEWYKAAYYDALSSTYTDYPNASDVKTACGGPPGGSNSANCEFAVRSLTDVGAYAGSQSAFGTFDQGGNVVEWNEAFFEGERGLRGGSWLDPPGSDTLAASFRDFGNPATGTVETGFRVGATIPEPGTACLVTIGLSMLAARRSSLRGGAARPR